MRLNPFTLRFTQARALILVTSFAGSATATSPGDADVRVRVEIDGRAYVGQLDAAAPTTAPASQPAEAPAVALAGGPVPFAVHLSAIAEVDVARLRDTRVTWTFGDAAGRFDTLIGFNAAHVYDRPGTYTLTRTIDSPDGRRTQRYTLDVKPNARRSVYVAADGDDRGEGATPDRPVRTWARAAALVRGNTQVLFRRGETFAVDRGITIRGNDVRIGAFGDEALPRPTLAVNAPLAAITLIDIAGDRFVIEDVAFDATYSRNFEKTNMPDCLHPAGHGAVVRNCTFRNVNYAVNGNGAPDGVLLIGNDAPLETGLRGYFAWVQGTSWTILDNRAANSTREHIVRVGGAEGLNVQFNRFANLDRSKARENPDPSDMAKSAVNVQKGRVGYVANNVLTGPSSVGPLGKADGLRDKPARFVGAVVEHNRIDGPLELKHGASNVTYRNNLIRATDLAAIPIDGADAEFGRSVDDVRIEHNTAINTGRQGSFVTLGGGASNVSLVSNLYVAPELIPGAYGSAAVYVAEADLRAFAEIANNCWPIAKPLPYAQNGVNYLAPQWGEQAGYLDPREWGLLSRVSGDRFVAAAADVLNVDGAGVDAALLPPQQETPR